MSNLKTSIKVAILAIVGLIMSIAAYSLTEFEVAFYLIYIFALAFAVSITVFVGGFISKNISNSKNINAIILFLFCAIISFVMSFFLGEDIIFYYIGIACVILLFISVFVLIARKLFKNELSSLNTPDVQVAEEKTAEPENTDENA